MQQCIDVYINGRPGAKGNSDRRYTSKSHALLHGVCRDNSNFRVKRLQRQSCPCHERHRRSSTPVPQQQTEMNGQFHARIPEEACSSHCVGGWVCVPQGRFQRRVHLSPLPESNSGQSSPRLCLNVRKCATFISRQVNNAEGWVIGEIDGGQMQKQVG